MKLNTWLRLSGTTLTSFAERIGVKRGLAYKYAKENVIPRRDVMTKIFIATFGQVSVNDFHRLSAEIFDDMKKKDK